MEAERSSAPLFQPLKMGDQTFPNRIVMAPLTRMRCDLPGMAGSVPNDLIVEHYRKRADQCALIVSEATWISPEGDCFPGSPGIVTYA